MDRQKLNIAAELSRKLNLVEGLSQQIEETRAEVTALEFVPEVTGYPNRVSIPKEFRSKIKQAILKRLTAELDELNKQMELL